MENYPNSSAHAHLDKRVLRRNLDGERLKGSLLHARYQTTSTQPLSQERGPRRTLPPLWKTAFTKVDCTHADFLRFVAAMRDID